MDDFFDFVKDKKETNKDETATSGNQGGPNQITDDIRAKARKLAESPKGLDILAFQRKHNIQIMNVDELLKG